jgi:hypothetical protein
VNNSINSVEQRVVALSSALRDSGNLCTPIRLGISAFSDFSVEAGFSSATNNANTLNNMVRQIAVHVDDLLNSAASMFAETDAAIATELLAEL